MPIPFAHYLPSKLPLAIDPDRLAQERLLIQGASGSGKSYLLRSLLETLADSGQSVSIIDPEGEYVTLAAKFPFAVIPVADLPNPASCYALAESAARHRQSYILDLSDSDPLERQSVVGSLITATLELPRTHWQQRFIAIDEAHELAPQSGNPASRQPIALLASKGRKRGLALLAATQRISKLCKNTAAELRNVLIGQTIIESDVKRSLEALCLPADFKHRSTLKTLDHTFLGFGPSIPVYAHPICANAPQTAPPTDGIKTAHNTPQPLTISHLFRKSGWRGGSQNILLTHTTKLSVADYFAACLAIGDALTAPTMPIPDPMALARVIRSAVKLIDPEAYCMINPSPNPTPSTQYAYAEVYWGNSLPLWVQYLQPVSEPQPLDTVLRGHPIYTQLTEAFSAREAIPTPNP